MHYYLDTDKEPCPLNHDDLLRHGSRKLAWFGCDMPRLPQVVVDRLIELTGETPEQIRLGLLPGFYI